MWFSSRLIGLAALILAVVPVRQAGAMEPEVREIVIRSGRSAAPRVEVPAVAAAFRPAPGWLRRFTHRHSWPCKKERSTRLPGRSCRRSGRTCRWGTAEKGNRHGAG